MKNFCRIARGTFIGVLFLTYHFSAFASLRSSLGRIFLRQQASSGIPSKGAAPLAAGSDIVADPRPLGTLEIEVEGKLSHTVEAENMVVRADGRIRKHAETLKAPLSLQAMHQFVDDVKLARFHAALGNTFRVLNPETGAYDKEQMVPATSVPYVLKKSLFDSFVQSNGPLLRAMRDILQRFLAQPAELVSADALDLKGLAEREREQFLRTMVNSVYYYPALHHPSMGEYPCIPVVGSDLSIEQPEGGLGLSTLAYEINTGTPSGASNNNQLKRALSVLAPGLHRELTERSYERNHFALLKDTIDANARAWTEGHVVNPEDLPTISVVVGPGVYNGAHPDVAYLAHFSGMPLVSRSDLYIDELGRVRLLMGNALPDPIVTGIYARMEEHFLLSSFESGVPLASPDTLNKEFAQGLGLNPAEFKEGVLYDWEWENGNIVGVKRDELGMPKLQENFERLGIDPALDEAEAKERGGLLDALHRRQIYISNVGGRLVDDKKLFELGVKVAREKFMRDGERSIISPPETLDSDEVLDLLGKPDEERRWYVVKLPDESGGKGVYIMPFEDRATRERVWDLVRANPDRYIVQKYVRNALLPAINETRDEQREPYWGTRAHDARLFVFMDEKGDVKADPGGILLRVAKQHKALANTSSGGGYAAAYVVSDDGSKVPAEERQPVLPVPPSHPYLSKSQKENLIQFTEGLNFVTEGILFEKSALTEENLRKTLTQFVIQYKGVMHLLGHAHTPLLDLSIKYLDGEIDFDQFKELFWEARLNLLDYENFAVEGVREIIRAHYNWDLIYKDKKSRTIPAKAPQKYLEYRASGQLATPYLVKTFILNGKRIERYAVGLYDKVDFEGELQGQIDEFKRQGGRFIHVQDYKVEEGKWSDNTSIPSFSLDDDHNPVIHVDMRAPYIISSLAHELSHFRDWQVEKNTLVLRGVDDGEARKQAFDRTKVDVHFDVEGERKAVFAEMNAQRMYESESDGQRPYTLALDTSEPDYISRLSYPKVEGLRFLLAKDELDEAERVLAMKYMRELLLDALRFRKIGYNKLYLAYQYKDKKITLSQLQYFYNQNPFKQIFKKDEYQFVSMGKWDDLYHLYREVVRDLFVEATSDDELMKELTYLKLDERDPFLGPFSEKAFKISKGVVARAPLDKLLERYSLSAQQ